MDKKTQPGDKFIVRFPPGMRDRLAAQARANNRSMNAEIVALLQERLPGAGDSLTPREQALVMSAVRHALQALGHSPVD